MMIGWIYLTTSINILLTKTETWSFSISTAMVPMATH